MGSTNLAELVAHGAEAALAAFRTVDHATRTWYSGRALCNKIVAISPEVVDPIRMKYNDTAEPLPPDSSLRMKAKFERIYRDHPDLATTCFGGRMPSFAQKLMVKWSDWRMFPSYLATVCDIKLISEAADDERLEFKIRFETDEAGRMLPDAMKEPMSIDLDVDMSEWSYAPESETDCVRFEINSLLEHLASGTCTDSLKGIFVFVPDDAEGEPRATEVCWQSNPVNFGQLSVCLPPPLSSCLLAFGVLLMQHMRIGYRTAPSTTPHWREGELIYRLLPGVDPQSTNGSLSNRKRKQVQVASHGARQQQKAAQSGTGSSGGGSSAAGSSGAGPSGVGPSGVCFD